MSDRRDARRPHPRNHRARGRYTSRGAGARVGRVAHGSGSRLKAQARARCLSLCQPGIMLSLPEP